MSTSYYRLKPPITSVRATVGGGHTHLGIWVNHAKAGEIALRNEEVANVMRILTDDEEAVMRFEDGGRYEYEFWDEDVELYTPLVSEDGKITTLADLGLTEEQLKEYRL